MGDRSRNIGIQPSAALRDAYDEEELSPNADLKGVSYLLKHRGDSPVKDATKTPEPLSHIQSRAWIVEMERGPKGIGLGLTGPSSAVGIKVVQNNDNDNDNIVVV